MEAAAQTPKPKRTANACQRCRSRKVKCTGIHPCSNCQRHSVFCLFEEDKKILVSEHELTELRQRVRELEAEREEPRHKRRRLDSAVEGYAEIDDTPVIIEEALIISPPTTHDGATSRDGRREERFSTNPLVSPSAYVKHRDPRRRRPWLFLGPTSTWSFSRRVLNLVHDRLRPDTPNDIPIPVDGDAYTLPGLHSRADRPPDLSSLPSLDYAMYLMNTVKFHLGQTLRLFDEEEFLLGLHEFYENAGEKVEDSQLWYVQFLVMLAFGKGFLASAKSDMAAPAGSEYFTRAMSLLPDTTKLWEEPILAIETLALIALYFYSIDMRDSAYCYVGHAMRMALVEGFHREMPIGQLGEKMADRCNNIWWTVYILDQQFASLMGAPVSVQEEDITAIYHNRRQSTQRAAALRLNVKISRVISQVLNTVYSVDGKLDGNFLQRVGSMLRRMADLARELDDVFENKFRSSVDTLSGVTTRLNLSYHQCIIVATRPLIVSLLRDRLDSFGKDEEVKILSAPVYRLFQVCIDSAVKSLKILTALREQKILETFLPFDLEHTFSAAFALVLVDSVLPGSVPDQGYKELVFQILDDMISKGNRVAQMRKSELELLITLLDPMSASLNLKDLERQGNIYGSYGLDASNGTPGAWGPEQIETTVEGDHLPGQQSNGLGTPLFSWHDLGGNIGLSPLQMLDMAEQLDVNRTMTEGGGDIILQDDWLWSEKLR